MYCKNCGKEIDNAAVICPHCGVMQKEISEEQKNLSVNGLGIAGFVIGLLSLYFGVFFCIASILGIALSAVALSKKERHSFNGLAVAGLVISILSLVTWGLVLIIAGMEIFI